MSRHQHHYSRNERSYSTPTPHPHPHPRHESRHETRHQPRDRHEKKKITTKNLAATLGMMGLAIGATLLVEGGPWKSRMAAAATVVGMEQMLENGRFFDEERRADGDSNVDARERRTENRRDERDFRESRYERRRGYIDDDNDDEEDEWRYRDRRERERERERENRRVTRGTIHEYESHGTTRRERDTHEDERRHWERERERRARREANRRFDEQYEIEEVLV